MLYLADREETRGPWIGMKKALLRRLLVLDVRKLDRQTIDLLLKLYDSLRRTSVSRLKQQFVEANSGVPNFRTKLDTELLTTVTHSNVSIEDLKPIYQIMKEEDF
jgi:uncharacterized protein YfkK (UPF0435 family)